jgi:hypothetical protein
MLGNRMNNKGMAILEYALLFLILIGAYQTMQFYISRAFQGQFKKSGDSLGMGRRYDPKATAECAYTQYNSDYGFWYNDTCLESINCGPRDYNCEDQAMSVTCKTDFCCEHQVAGERSNCSP